MKSTILICSILLTSCGAAERKDLVAGFANPSQAQSAATATPIPTPATQTGETTSTSVDQSGNGNVSVVVNTVNNGTVTGTTEVAVQHPITDSTCDLNVYNGDIVAYVLEQRQFSNSHWFSAGSFQVLNLARRQRADDATNGFPQDNMQIAAQYSNGCLTILE